MYSIFLIIQNQHMDIKHIEVVRLLFLKKNNVDHRGSRKSIQYLRELWQKQDDEGISYGIDRYFEA